MNFSVDVSFGAAAAGASVVAVNASGATIGSGVLDAGGGGSVDVAGQVGDKVRFWLGGDPARQAGPLTLESPLSQTAEEVAAALRGGGPLLFDPLVRDSLGNPIAGAVVRIAGGATPNPVGSTGGSGRVSWGANAGTGFVLPPGSYQAYLYATGYAQTGPLNVNLSADDEATEFVLSPFELPAPQEADRADIYFSNESLLRLFGGSALVTVESSEPGRVVLPGTFATEFKAEFYANDGSAPVFSMLTRAALLALNPEAATTFKVTCEAARLKSAVFEAPEAPGSYYLAELIEGYGA